MGIAAGGGLVQAVFLEFGVDGFGEAGLLEGDDLGGFQFEEGLEVRRCVVLEDRVVGVLGQDFLAAGLGEIGGDEDEVEFAFAAGDGVAADDERAGAQDEWEEALDRLGLGRWGCCGCIHMPE